MRIAELVIDWFRDNARDLPWRRPETSPWGVLVSEVMLQQTPVQRVIPRFEEWMRRWPTPEHLAAEAPGEAVRAWHRLGYPRRALRLHASAVAIVTEHDGKVPSDIAALRALPGVGEYTACAVASFAFGQRHAVVDTNVRRVLARSIDGHGEAAPPRIRVDREAMEAVLPIDPERARITNAAVMELGAIVCTARAPRCAECPLSAVCAWRRAGYPRYEGARRTPQARFDGSDRQVRGIVIDALRRSNGPLTRRGLEALWPDAVQLQRAILSLKADGLIERTADRYSLPGASAEAKGTRNARA